MIMALYIIKIMKSCSTTLYIIDINIIELSNILLVNNHNKILLQYENNVKQIVIQTLLLSLY